MSLKHFTPLAPASATTSALALITKGIGRYPGNFAVPTQPFPTS